LKPRPLDRKFDAQPIVPHGTQKPWCLGYHHHSLILTIIFKVKLGYPAQFCYSIFSGREPAALKGTQSTDPNQDKSFMAALHASTVITENL